MATSIGIFLLLIVAVDGWSDSDTTSADVLPGPTTDLVAGGNSYYVCGTCHGAKGQGNAFVNAPKLVGLSAWYLERQLKNFRQGLRGTDADDTPGIQMASMALMLADDAAINNVVAYLISLPETDSTPTVSGDPGRGKDIFSTCKSCHGPNGEGTKALKAPRLSGADDWYLVRQLNNYKRGIRGSHPQDLYGKQMALQAGVLRDEQDIKDVVAYINTLQQ